jgi:membrane-bound metal-dependent hydrolase YbcI (DUF457 family)
MDPVTHFIVSLAAGYLLVLGLGLRIRSYTVPLLGTLALFIDVDHLLPVAGITKTLIFHNIAAVLLAALVVWRIGGRGPAIIFSSMLVGHILLDMNTGIYGVPLLFPLSTTKYLVPDSWEIWLFNDSRYTLLSRTGISLIIYSAYLVGAYLVFRRRGEEQPRHR